MEKLKGPFKDIILEFQNYKKSLGYSYDNINSFYELDNYLFHHGIKDLNNTELIFNIAVKQETNFSRKKSRYNCLKQLYEFMKILEYTNLYFEEMNFKKETDFVPKILTKQEVDIFFKNVDQNSSILNNKEKYIYPVLFRLLYSSGLRISEALNLKLTDISTNTGTITVVKSKNNITRFIPLSTSMNHILMDYLTIVKPQIYLFEINNKPISYEKVSDFFKGTIIGIRDFRIHDLRHTFSVTVFNKLYNEGYSFNEILYLLHIYLGHKDLESTEYYLRMTNESYINILNKSHKKYPNIVPKVDGKK